MNNQALDGNSNVLRLVPSATADVIIALHELEQQILDELNRQVVLLNGIKWNIAILVRFTKLDSEGNVLETEATFVSDIQRLFAGDERQPQIAGAFQTVFRQSEEFEANGSGWTLDQVIHLDVHSVVYAPIAANSYIKTPKRLISNGALINVQNSDDKCIVWSILAQLYPCKTTNVCRVRSYRKHESKLSVRNVRFPTPLVDINKIEKQNNVSIHVFGYEGEIHPLRLSKSISQTHINLLVLQNEEKFHYCLIKDFNRLMRIQKKTNKRHHCYNCLHGFVKKENLLRHRPRCENQRAQAIVMPKEDEQSIEFKNISRQLRAPFVVYADFECYTQRTGEMHKNAYQKHIPSGFCFKVVSSEDLYTKPSVLYRGPNVVECFFHMLIREEKWICKNLSLPKAMQLSSADKIQFAINNTCHICGKPIENVEEKVRDHCHLTGVYRGPAHNNCNLQFKWQTTRDGRSHQFVIPVIFHNLRGYDGHLLMSAFGKFKERKLRCIPNNRERYLSVSSDSLRFIDSFQFMSSSLDRLVSNLSDEGIHKFNYLRSEFKENASLLCRKGVFPYDYVESEKQLNDTCLPPIEKFYSELYECNISQEDYNHAQNVWVETNCKTLGDYHDIYLRVDVLQLADVFENFRSTALSTYKLDPAHYFTAPGLSWDSMLK